MIDADARESYSRFESEEDFDRLDVTENLLLVLARVSDT